MLPALVLTAGLGTRLDPITRLVAKPAVPLGHATLVEHVLMGVARRGVRHAVLNLHHRPESIARVVGDGSHLGLSVRYSWEQPLLGSAGGPRKALPLLDSDVFLIVNGDTLCDVDLDALVADHEKTGADVTLAVVPNPAPHHYNGLIADRDGRVTGRELRGQATGSWHLVGVQVARRSVFERLPEGAPAETVSALYRELWEANPGCIRIHQTSAPFLDVGTPADYLDTALRLTANGGEGAGRPLAHHAVPGVGTRQSTLVDTVVWPGAEIGDDVELTRCVVVGDVLVPSGTRAADAVIAPAGLRRADEQAVEVRNNLAFFPFQRAVDSSGA
jgi:NDP-sugar pyrophosphorylase family protein